MRLAWNLSTIILVLFVLSGTAFAATGDNLNVDLLGRWASGPCFDVALSGSIVCAGDGAMLRVLDISSPGAPVELGSVLLPNYVRGVAIQGNYAFVANHYDGLRIIDISNTAAPAEVGFFAIGDAATDVAVQGNYAYVAASDVGLRIVDISTPTAPSGVGTIDLLWTWSVAVAGDLAYVGGIGSTIHAIDVSNPASPSQISSAEAQGDTREIVANGDHV